ncbi:hypothetical protein ACN4EE_00080 [Geminocystis sp. CENA526]
MFNPYRHKIDRTSLIPSLRGTKQSLKIDRTPSPSLQRISPLTPLT